MLTILGKKQRYCDGVSRRNFLKVGAVGFGGLTLADMLRADAAAGNTSSKKSIINIYLGGGPSHIDMWDLKPEAPIEIRGEFQPIKTKVPGIDICYLMPKLAAIMDKLVIVRSISGLRDEHAPNQTESGWSESDMRNSGGRPSMGAVVAKLDGPTNGSVPTFVAMGDHTKAGFLGPVYSAFRPDGPGRANLTLQKEIGIDRFQNRSQLLTELDRVRRDMDSSRTMEAMDSFNQRAASVLTSSQLADALDIMKEDPRSRERYGLNDPNKRENEKMLVARRLVETGVRCVSLNFGGWDTHSNNFPELKRQLPQLDTAVSALVEDLDERGMLNDVSIAVWGEFGRSPRINGTGRDHWSHVAAALLAGGGMRPGQVIGSTNRYGETPQDRPVHIQEIFATLYHLMGIDVNKTTIRDPNGRPQYLVDVREPMRELV